MNMCVSRRSGHHCVGRAPVFLLLFGLSVAGCITPASDNSDRYVRNGVRYGVTEGRFRGRWWNFYEQGRSYQDGAFWAEAEKGFRTALAGRAKDQLWARTYGLHFIAEYFPHRELGVTLFHQGRLDEAITELEVSLQQQYSARAAYFLNEARATRIKSQQADAAPPTAEILTPESADPAARAVGAARTQLSGVAKDDTFVARISVNGVPCLVPVSAPEVPFSREIDLSPGDNEIRVEVEDLAGKVTVMPVKVYCDVDGPAVSFDKPVVLPGTVSGVAHDPAGVSALRIGGKTVPFAPGTQEPVTFSVAFSREDLAPPLRYECEDAFGNVTSGVLPLDTLIVSDTLPEVLPAISSAAFIPLANGLEAWMVGGQLVALRAAPAVETAPRAPEVRFANLREGQKYLMPEIVVGLDVDAVNDIARVQLNGKDIQAIPGRKVQHLSRRVPLEPGSNALTAAAHDTAGLEGMAHVAVERQLTTVEDVGRRLRVAMLGNVWKGNSPMLEGEAQVILDELARELLYYKRFDPVDRSLLPTILAEQQLNAALGSKEERLALGKTVPADVMFIGKVRRDADTIEIILEGISTETSLFIARADVAGRANDLDQLKRLVKDLALRVVQEFPRVQGQVALVRNPNVFVSNLSAVHLIQESMKCLVFRYGQEIVDPTTGTSLGRDTEILAEGLVQQVDARKSTVGVTTREEPYASEAIEVGHYVITK